MLDFSKFLLCLMLFCTVACVKRGKNSPEDIRAINNALGNAQWNTINDVEYVKYWHVKYYLENLVRNKVRAFPMRRRVRIATLFLGCTTANFLYAIFEYFENFRIYCAHFFNEDSSKINGCVDDLVNILPSIDHMLIKIRGAMNAIESFRGLPWELNKRQNYILKNVIEFLHYHQNSYPQLPLYDSFEENMRSLVTIRNFNHKLKRFIDSDVKKFCDLKHNDDPRSVWNEWIKEYEDAVQPAKHSELSKHLGERIHEKVENFILEKYTKLGFQYDSETGITTIMPTPDEGTVSDVEENIDTDYIESAEENIAPNGSGEEESSTKFNVEEPNTQPSTEDSEDLFPSLIEYPQHLVPFNYFIN